MDVVGYDLVFMVVESIVYFALTLIIDKVINTPSLVTRFRVDPRVGLDGRVIDEDVANEMQRVQSGGASRDLIVVKGIRKVFPPRKVAARDVWFGIPSGQCFGFLGVNGAGKTTVLRVLTGEIGRAVQQECRDRSRMPSSA
eukprot:TRINITY_DN7582_c0_g1_i4.p1 TRINITY_DN7582_c0_g1~~TRINITY_DN7582_c0_g1_i4.p1  ORF type:complete len:141 (+),score=28.34 TRINITY_DN7582_c0_g1_i4:78-500(+)